MISNSLIIAEYPAGKKVGVLTVEFAMRGILCLGLN